MYPQKSVALFLEIPQKYTLHHTRFKAEVLSLNALALPSLHSSAHFVEYILKLKLLIAKLKSPMIDLWMRIRLFYMLLSSLSLIFMIYHLVENNQRSVEMVRALKLKLPVDFQGSKLF